MMTREQYLLGKLAEEALEVAHMALKCSQFGLTDVWPDQTFTNLERLENEIVDYEGVLQMLSDECAVMYRFNLDPGTYFNAFEAKILKVNKYYEHSRSLGRVE